MAKKKKMMCNESGNEEEPWLRTWRAPITSVPYTRISLDTHDTLTTLSERTTSEAGCALERVGLGGKLNEEEKRLI